MGSIALGTRVARAPQRQAGARPSRLPPWLRALLTMPLLGKLAGANAVIVVAAAATALATHAGRQGEARTVVLLVASLLVALVVDLVLVYVALRPLWELEATADRVWRGDLHARVPRSALADRDMERLGRTVNLLLDGLGDDRERLRRLASQVISAGDEERARIARELHDSTAQTLAALQLQASAAARDSRDPALVERLELVRQLANDAVEEVRLLSHTVHPRVLDDLGLVAALEWLARQAREHDGFDVTVDARLRPTEVPPAAAAVLYRVAQEALRNAMRHADATEVRLTLTADDRAATLEVCDDGAGFDVADAEARRPGMGLFTMRERVALVDGQLTIDGAPGAGTRVTATVPLDARPLAPQEHGT